MRSPLQKLTPTERETLALLYDKPDWKVICKLIDSERIELAKDAIEQDDILQVKDLYGQSKALKKLIGTVKENFNQLNKKQN